MKRFVLFAAMLGVMCAATSFGVVKVSISGTSATLDQPLIDFITNNFQDVTVTYGDYSNPANIPAGTNIFMVGRNLGSTAYANAANSATFNALTIPVVCFTSYVSRTNGGRWAWESGDVTGVFNETGAETTVTAAGATILGVAAGSYDFITVSGSEYGLGTGTVGGGAILATVNNNILAAGWTTGQLSAGGATFGGNRLLWNTFQGVSPNPSTIVLPDTEAGKQALISALEKYTGLPGKNSVSNPSPVNNASGVALNVTLQWDGAKDPSNPGQINPAVRKHYVYADFNNKDSDPNLYYQGEVVVTGTTLSASWGPLSLTYDQGVSWQIEEGLDNGLGGVYAHGDPNNWTGPVWKFTSLPSVPFPTQQTSPAFQAKFVGETAGFTVVFSSSSPMNHQWYKSIDNANNTATDDTEVGTDAAALTLPALTLENAGYYYCKATNSTGSSLSNPARLSIKRQIAHWALDGNANDSSGNGVNGTLFGGPSFVDGVNTLTGQALAFDGVNDYIAEPNTTADFRDFAPGITLTVWAKPTAAGTWARFVDFGNGPQSDNIYVSRVGTGTDLALGVGIGTAAPVTVAAANVMVLNEWQMFAVTMNESGSVVIYKNGLSVGTGTIASRPNVVNRTQNYVGKSNWTADALYAGSMDDIQIWNYAKTADDVANMYAAVVGNFCRNRPVYDYDNNCKVNLGDFAIFAAHWLECGLYPACP